MKKVQIENKTKINFTYCFELLCFDYYRFRMCNWISLKMTIAPKCHKPITFNLFSCHASILSASADYKSQIPSILIINVHIHIRIKDKIGIAT